MNPVSYEMRGTTAILTIDRPSAAMPSTTDGRRAPRRPASASRPTTTLVDDPDRARRRGLLRGRRPEGDGRGGAVARPRSSTRSSAGPGPDGLLPPDPVEAARSRRSAAGAWQAVELALWCDLRVAAAGPVRLPRASLGRATDRRRHGASAADRRPGRALDLILTGRIIETDEALDWGCSPRSSTKARHLDRALEIAAGLARFPQQRRCSPTGAQ